MKKVFSIIIGLLVLLFFIQVVKEKDTEVVIPLRTPDRDICVGEYCDGHMDAEERTVLHIPLITTGDTIGCGSDIFFAPHTVSPKTDAVMDATYKTLFALKPQSEIESDDIRNTVGTETALTYKNVMLNDGVARLYLEGTLYTTVHCAVPEFTAQIEQAALQFNTVHSLEVYRNGDLWDWCDFSEADPEESGCDTSPRLWVVEK